MPDRAFTLDEVAECYRFTPRWLRDFIRTHNIPVFHTGKQIRFDGLAIVALEEALRRPCPSKSADAKTAATRSPSAAPSNYPMARGSAFEHALNLTAPTSRAKKPPPLKQKSSATPGTGNVVALAPSRKRSPAT
jgi:hypothetical protein